VFVCLFMCVGVLYKLAVSPARARRPVKLAREVAVKGEEALPEFVNVADIIAGAHGLCVRLRARSPELR
jgi:hypothetical protein